MKNFKLSVMLVFLVAVSVHAAQRNQDTFGAKKAQEVFNAGKISGFKIGAVSGLTAAYSLFVAMAPYNRGNEAAILMGIGASTLLGGAAGYCYMAQPSKLTILKTKYENHTKKDEFDDLNILNKQADLKVKQAQEQAYQAVATFPAVLSTVMIAGAGMYIFRREIADVEKIVYKDWWIPFLTSCYNK